MSLQALLQSKSLLKTLTRQQLNTILEQIDPGSETSNFKNKQGVIDHILRLEINFDDHNCQQLQGGKSSINVVNNRLGICSDLSAKGPVNFVQLGCLFLSSTIFFCLLLLVYSQLQTNLFVTVCGSKRCQSNGSICSGIPVRYSFAAIE